MPKLFMILMGCKPFGRHTEQHDIFFGIADNLKELVPAMRKFWPEAKGKIHLDAYRIVNYVDGYKVEVVPRSETKSISQQQLFFINLGGYQEGIFEELHYKMLLVAADKDLAVKNAKKSSFFKNYITPHIDDKYGVDVDDIFNIEEALPSEQKEKYQLRLIPSVEHDEDDIMLGYIPIYKL